jgi:hypothetical protein
MVPWNPGKKALKYIAIWLPVEQMKEMRVEVET